MMVIVDGHGRIEENRMGKNRLEFFSNIGQTLSRFRSIDEDVILNQAIELETSRLKFYLEKIVKRRSVTTDAEVFLFEPLFVHVHDVNVETRLIQQ